MTTVEKFIVGTIEVSIMVDEDPQPVREEGCGNFLFLGFPHRSYKIGDETLDPFDPFECPFCEGTGWLYNDETASTDIGCPRCDTSGEISAKSMPELTQLVKAKYKAEVILPVGMIDHSGVAYYIGTTSASDSAGWDSGQCGFILDTPEVWAERGRPMPDQDNPETIAKWMAEEIDQYSKWASGEVYGYVLRRDPDLEPTDDEIRRWSIAVAHAETTEGLYAWLDRRFEESRDDQSCWGLIGYEYAIEEATRAAQDQQPASTLQAGISAPTTPGDE